MVVIFNIDVVMPRECESDKEKAKFKRVLEDHRKFLYPSAKDGKKLGATLELLQ